MKHIEHIGRVDNFFVISDTHFFHSKTIFEFQLRPQFKTVEEMNETMFRNWQTTIKPDDLVIFLGDWVIGYHGNKFQVAQIIYDSLNGKKIFIQGNHDKNINQYTTVHAHEKPISVIYNETSILLSHEPIYDFDEDIAIFGHVHDGKGMTFPSNMFNASVEAINFTPINIDLVLFEIYEKRNYLKPQIVIL